MYFKSKKYLKNRLNEFVSVSDLDINELKDNLLPIIKGVDTYCWSYIKNRERNSSRVVSVSLKTDSDVLRLFNAVKQTNSVWKVYEYVPSTELKECFAYFDIQRVADFKQLLEDPECRDIIEEEANVKFIFNFDRKNDLYLLAKERRRLRREQEKVNDIYSYFNYTWDEKEALAAVTDKRHIWVVRTNEYPNLPALFFYPKNPINSKDEEELISKYGHKLATAYKYELRDPSVNAYWLARPCRYPRFKEHPMPDGSELIKETNESKNRLTNMNTLNRDRNTLKRLVESYGKKDVLNFVRHLNENINGLTEEEKSAVINSIDFYMFESGGSSFYADDDEFGRFYDAELQGETLKLYISDEYDLGDPEDGYEYDTCLLRFLKSSPRDKQLIKNLLNRINSIVVYYYDGEYSIDGTVLNVDAGEYPSVDIELNSLAADIIGSW